MQNRGGQPTTTISKVRWNSVLPSLTIGGDGRGFTSRIFCFGDASLA